MTCHAKPTVDDDGPALLAALAAAGVDASVAVWKDAHVDESSYDLVVVRSTWDYIERREEFLAWAVTVPRLADPAGVLAWNTDKRYLADLADAASRSCRPTSCPPGSPSPPGPTSTWSSRASRPVPGTPCAALPEQTPPRT